MYMQRKARIDAPGALLHIIVRGIEKKYPSQKPDPRLNRIQLMKEFKYGNATDVPRLLSI